MDDMRKKKLDAERAAEILLKLPKYEQERVLGFIECMAHVTGTDTTDTDKRSA